MTLAERIEMKSTYEDLARRVAELETENRHQRLLIIGLENQYRLFTESMRSGSLKSTENA